MSKALSSHEKKLLLKYARESILSKLQKREVTFDSFGSTDLLNEKGASFVTLTLNNKLRGCIGTLEAYQSLVQDVCENAIAAATRDFRFRPVNLDELAQIHIEVSYLSRPIPLMYDSADDLIEQIRPGIDGVVLKSSYGRATFLPQVWEKIETIEDFLSNLCLKMGAEPELWKKEKLAVSLYQVEEFHE